MRFLQLHTFYDEYLAKFFAARPHLTSQPYEAQLATLLDDAFTASHLFAPVLARLGHDARLLVGNCAPLQNRWALENLGRLPSSLMEVTKLQIEHYRPDVLYVSDPITFNSRFLRSLSFRPHLTFGWRAAEFPAWVDLTSFDLILSNEQSCMRQAESHGAARTQHFLPGFPEWVAERVASEQKSSDLIFCGQLTPLHTRRVALLEELSQHARTHQDFTPRFCIRGAPGGAVPCADPHAHLAVWGLEMHREIKRGRIGLNSVIDFAKGEAGNMRQFEVTGTGTMLLTEHNPSLGSQFKLGHEVETYSSFSELIEKITFYLNHPDEREAIARRGQERCLREHGMVQRSAELLDVVQSQMAKGPRRNRTSPQGPEDSLSKIQKFLQDAIRAVQESRFDEGYKLVLSAQSIGESAPLLLHVRALCLLHMQRYVEAIEDLTMELKLFPQNVEAQTLLSHVLQAVNRGAS